MNIIDLITDNTNIIEIYLTNANPNNNFKIDLVISNQYLNKIRQRFKLTKETTMVSFNRNNLSYIYDLSNDSQYVNLRKLENLKIVPFVQNHNFYGLAFNEMKMQSHSFNCTNIIDSRDEYKIEEYKINNRISLIIKNNYIYIHYIHSKDVDLEKTQQIINGIIKKMI
jgi:hypothetical protein